MFLLVIPAVNLILPSPSPSPKTILQTINSGTDCANNGVITVLIDHNRTASMSTVLHPKRLAVLAPMILKKKTICWYKCTKFIQQHDGRFTWLVKYPKAKADSIQPCQYKFHLNSSVISTIAIGMMTRSAALMKFAAEQSATIRDVRGSILNLGIFDLCARESTRCSQAIKQQLHRTVQAYSLAMSSRLFSAVFTFSRKSCTCLCFVQNKEWRNKRKGEARTAA